MKSVVPLKKRFSQILPLLYLILIMSCGPQGRTFLFPDTATDNDMTSSGTDTDDGFTDNASISDVYLDNEDLTSIDSQTAETLSDAWSVDGDALEFDTADHSTEWWGKTISAPPDEWTWIPFPDSACADGSPTGIGINLHPGATKALIYLGDGGACWNYDNCKNFQTALHLEGFDKDDFEGIIANVFMNSLLMNRTESKNPLADAHYVFIPYCTGDIHSGDRVVDLEGSLPWQHHVVHFKGHRNIKVFLKRLVPTFQDVDHVIVGGSSAGGFGAGFNWLTVQDAFGGIRVDLLDDSGPPVEPKEGIWTDWVETWNAQLPEDCDDCHLSVPNLFSYIFENTLPNSRMGLLSYDQDSVISGFMGLTAWTFKDRLREVCDSLDEEPQARYFVIGGLLHNLLAAGYDLIQSSDGTPVWEWVDQMIQDDPEWANHWP